MSPRRGIFQRLDRQGPEHGTYALRQEGCLPVYRRLKPVQGAYDEQTGCHPRDGQQPDRVPDVMPDMVALVPSHEAPSRLEGGRSLMEVRNQYPGAHKKDPAREKQHTIQANSVMTRSSTRPNAKPTKETQRGRTAVRRPIVDVTHMNTAASRVPKVFISAYASRRPAAYVSFRPRDWGPVPNVPSSPWETAPAAHSMATNRSPLPRK